MKNKFKILLTNDAERIAGGEKYVLYLANALKNNGHQIYLAPLRNSELADKSKQMGFETFEIPYGLHGKEFNAIRILYQNIRTKKIDIIHSNSGLDRTIAAYAGRITGALNITTIHSCLSIRNNFMHAFRNKFLLDHFTPVGNSIRKILTDIDKIPSEKITVVNIGIPRNEISFNPEGRQKIREQLKIPAEQIVLGTLSRLVEFKGHKFLLRAVKQLQNQGKNFVLIIAGDGPLKNDLMDETKMLGISDRVFFLGHRTDITDILSSMDIFVQPSKDFGGETFPVAILEALSIGLPVVASEVGDLSTLVNETNGILTNPEDVQELSVALNSLISNKGRIVELGKNSRKKFESEFTVEIMTERMEKVYKRVLNEKNPDRTK
ncbi:MAG: glycosyltransferase family 4 protein [Ignavibacteriaceae bacterium]|nr:glycosyltransferase family 4 protein [Ignavibacteriaceae bacterium]